MRAYKTGYQTPEYRADVRQIISVDGEGKTVSDRHAYVLLAASDDKGYQHFIEHDGSERPGSPGYQSAPYEPGDMAPNYGLPTERMLEFLLGLPESPGRLLISFSFTYDITKILQDLPYASLCEFAKLGVTSWRGYTIAGLPRKYLEIWHGDRYVKVWDTFAYWQMSFARALESSPELFTTYQQSVIDQIKLMKGKRSDETEWTAMSAADVRAYCFSECEFLSILFRDFLRHCEEMDLKPSNRTAWGGPGSLAASFFRNVGLKSYMPRGNHDSYLSGLPADVAKFSFYGGRFETSVLGPAGDVTEYDIQSAYPAIAVGLPCLKCGQFVRTKKFVSGSLGFYYAGSRTSGPWAPFPFRADKDTGYLLNGASKGSIAFVHGGRRWVTSAEIETAIKYFGSDAIPVYEGWVFIPGCDHKPFAEVLQLYLRRKIGNPSCVLCLADKRHFCPEHPAPSAGLSKVIKLIINAVYGKLAQSIGWDLIAGSQLGMGNPASWKPPETQCYIWAAWITGGTRALVMEAAMIGGREPGCPECFNGETQRACERHSSVRSIATDGILTKTDIPELPVTDWKLGTWERASKPDAWIGMPGIYSFRDAGKPDCDSCQAKGNACAEHASDKKFKRRGLDARYFPAQHLREAWERGEWKVQGMGDPDNCAECASLHYGCSQHPIRAFMPLKLAVTRVNALDVMGEWIKTAKTVKFLSVQHKRNIPETADPFMPHDGSAIRLESITIPDDTRSAPYQPKQSWEDVLAGRVSDFDIAIWDDSEDLPEYHEMEM